jgi:hypothetical protein
MLRTCARLFVPGLTLLAVVVIGCSKPPPPEPPPPPPPPKVEKPKPPPPPPPPPKCEAIDEGCKAEDSTKLKVGTKGMWFHPPTGWTYAREKDLSVAFNAEKDAAIAMVEAKGAKPDQIMAALLPLMDRLKIQNVKDKNLQNRLRRPQHKMEAGKTKMQVWEVNKKNNLFKDPTMDGKAGSMVVVVLPFSDDKTLVGLGFEKQFSQTMVTSFQSARGEE